MTSTIIENGEEYHYEDFKILCSNWTSSGGVNIDQAEVVGLFKAALDNLRSDYIYSDANHIGEYAEIFSDQEIQLLLFLSHED